MLEIGIVDQDQLLSQNLEGRYVTDGRDLLQES